MALVVVATAGAANANSYSTLAEANSYYESRVPLDVWDNADDGQKNAALVMATRVLDMMTVPYQYFVPPTIGVNAIVGYYRTRPAWTGAPVDAVQALSWPRSGMLNRNGFAILTTVIPAALKEATAELAGQLLKVDRTLDSDTALKGIERIKAGPVEISYAAERVLMTKILPDAVMFLLVPSWLTAEVITSANVAAMFEVL